MRMTRDEFHNHLVMAYAKGVERCMEPFPASMRQDPASVAAHLGGAAAKYAQSVCELPAVAMKLD